MHVHARAQNGGDEVYFRAMTPTEESRIFLAAGVTGYLDAMQDEVTIFPARDQQRRANFEPPGADIFCAGAAFTPPNGHGTESAYGLPLTAYRIVNLQNAEVQVQDIADKKPDVVKIMYDHRGFDGKTIKDGEKGALGVAMEKGVMETLVKTANSLGLKPYVHMGVWQDADEAINAGAKIINHLGESSIPQTLVELAQKNHVYWIPTLALYHEYLNLINNPQLLHDELLKKVAEQECLNSYLPENIYWDEDYQYYQEKHTIPDPVSIQKLLQAGVKLVAGSDTIELGTFIGWSLHREMALFVAYGLSPWEALATATINAGEMLDRNFGIEPGAVGNVVVLGASPIENIWNTTKIEMVIYHGKKVAVNELSVLKQGPSPGALP
jgi:hypothetical protein